MSVKQNLALQPAEAVSPALLAVPPTALAYAFKDADLSLKRTLDPIRRQGLGRWMYQVVLPLLLSNWGVWIPAVVVIYCLPLPLQLPMQNLVLCFWSLLLIFQVRPETVHPSIQGAVATLHP